MILRRRELVRDILEAEICVKQGRGRPRLDYCSEIVKDVGCANVREMNRLAMDKSVRVKAVRIPDDGDLRRI